MVSYARSGELNRYLERQICPTSQLVEQVIFYGFPPLERQGSFRELQGEGTYQLPDVTPCLLLVSHGFCSVFNDASAY